MRLAISFFSFLKVGFFARNCGRKKQNKNKTYLINMFSGFGRSLDIRHSPLLSAILSFFQRHLSPFTEVAFITDQQERDVFVIFNS